MSILKSLILACVAALACGAGASILLLLGLNGLTRLTRRFDRAVTADPREALAGDSAAPEVVDSECEGQVELPLAMPAQLAP